MKKLIEKKGYQYNISGFLLLLLSTPFTIWQMGVVFYSSTTLSLLGRTPISLDQNVVSIILIIGYLVSMLFVFLFPRKTITAQRITMSVAFICTVAMLFEIPTDLVRLLYYADMFICVFSIGMLLSICVNQFTLATLWKDAIISICVGGIGVALLQNDFFDISFTQFIFLSLVLIAMQIALLYFIPAKIEMPFLSKKDNAPKPNLLLFGIWGIITLSTLLLCFASAYAESVKNGIPLLYASSAAVGLALFIIRKKCKRYSIKIFSVFLSLSVLGFGCVGLSFSFPVFSYIACILFGFVVALASLWVYFGGFAFSIYPSKNVGVIGAGIGLGVAILHSLLLQILRDNLIILYGIYCFIALALMLCYSSLEGYFMYAFSKQKNAQTIEKVNNALSVLSEQEGILAKLILDGHSETSAAQIMNISINTQKSYRKNLYSKLNIHSKKELFDLVNNAADK